MVDLIVSKNTVIYWSLFSPGVGGVGGRGGGGGVETRRRRTNEQKRHIHRDNTVNLVDKLI